MAAPPGAVEYYNGYPIIYPPTINPQADWVGIMEAQATWLDQRVQHKVANPTELAVKYSGLGATDQRLVAVESDKTLRWWSGTEWVTIGSSASPAWTTHTLAWFSYNGGTPAAVNIGDGTRSGRYSKVGRTVNWSFYITRGSSTQVGVDYYQFTLPFAAQNFRGFIGSGLVSATADEGLTVALVNQTTAVLIRPNGARLGSSSFTWATGHTIQGSLTYEATS